MTIEDDDEEVKEMVNRLDRLLQQAKEIQATRGFDNDELVAMTKLLSELRNLDKRVGLTGLQSSLRVVRDEE